MFLGVDVLLVLRCVVIGLMICYCCYVDVLCLLLGVVWGVCFGSCLGVCVGV